MVDFGGRFAPAAFDLTGSGLASGRAGDAGRAGDGAGRTAEPAGAAGARAAEEPVPIAGGLVVGFPPCRVGCNR